MKSGGMLFLWMAVLFLIAGPAQAGQFTITDLNSLGGNLQVGQTMRYSGTSAGYSDAGNGGIFRTFQERHLNRASFGKEQDASMGNRFHKLGRKKARSFINRNLKDRNHGNNGYTAKNHRKEKHPGVKKFRKKDRQTPASAWEDSIFAKEIKISDHCGFSHGYTITNADYSDNISIPAPISLGGQSIIPYSINDNGKIVGSFLTAEGDMHAFLYDGSELMDLNMLVTDLTDWDYLMAAYDINNNNDIVGVGMLNGTEHGFLLNASEPVVTPLPGSILLFASGILPFMLIRRRFSNNDTSL